MSETLWRTFVPRANESHGGIQSRAVDAISRILAADADEREDFFTAAEESDTGLTHVPRVIAILMSFERSDRTFGLLKRISEGVGGLEAGLVRAAENWGDDVTGSLDYVFDKLGNGTAEAQAVALGALANHLADPRTVPALDRIIQADKAEYPQQLVMQAISLRTSRAILAADDTLPQQDPSEQLVGIGDDPSPELKAIETVRSLAQSIEDRSDDPDAIAIARTVLIGLDRLEDHISGEAVLSATDLDATLGWLRSAGLALMRWYSYGEELWDLGETILDKLP